MNMADTPTPPAMPGEWMLIAPDGRCWVAESPLKCCKAEMDERVPADVAYARIMREAAAPAESERERQLREALEIADARLLNVDINYETSIARREFRAALAQPQHPGPDIVAVDHEGKPVHALSDAEFARCNPGKQESGNG